ncbi:endonuclease NucS domain-containing protein [Halotia branconii]|uniref:Endonuclease NucS n=1 Tax=Halotia branconii CENA392 TaxID=1539056 RepID=A0AAJ6NSX8_9CYAN|nr:endonuclease NucS domain-containing protein [Halotia branconii]WGV26027.1 endonuclease NucS [Halotia branconii CENA392]
MSQNIRIWDISSTNRLSEVKKSKLEAEQSIQDWLEQDIYIISDNLLVIGKEVQTDYGGFIDLLCLDKKGDIVIIELKRDKTPREVTAQALDYASWVKDLSNDTITSIANKYLINKVSLELDKAFQKTFNTELPEILNTNHQILIVASKIDSSSERIISYLSETYGVNINAVTFQYFCSEDGRKLLARVFLIEPTQVEENTQRQNNSKRQPNLSFEELDEIVKKHSLENLYSTLYKNLLNTYFTVVSTTRSSLSFKKGNKTIFTLIPVESNPEKGLKFRIYTTRFAQHWGINTEEIINLLPTSKYKWENYPDATPDWSGHEGFFNNLDEVDKFIAGLHKLTQNSV